MRPVWSFVVLLTMVGFPARTDEAQVSATRYMLNGEAFAVPHKYDFSRNYRLPQLQGVQGLDKEPEDSIWLRLPAIEVAEGVEGYERTFRGYASQVAADMVINIQGGREAAEFPEDYARSLATIDQLKRSGAILIADPARGWTRLFQYSGKKGTPGEGRSAFYLLPAEGASLPDGWLPPSCLASPDAHRVEIYSCSYTINHDGLTFQFTLRQESLLTASRIPGYVLARLNAWRQ